MLSLTHLIPLLHLTTAPPTSPEPLSLPPFLSPHHFAITFSALKEFPYLSGPHSFSYPDARLAPLPLPPLQVSSAACFRREFRGWKIISFAASHISREGGSHGALTKLLPCRSSRNEFYGFPFSLLLPITFHNWFLKCGSPPMWSQKFYPSYRNFLLKIYAFYYTVSSLAKPLVITKTEQLHGKVGSTNQDDNINYLLY